MSPVFVPDYLVFHQTNSLKNTFLWMLLILNVMNVILCLSLMLFKILILIFIMVLNCTLAHLLRPVTGTWFNSVSVFIEKDAFIIKLCYFIWVFFHEHSRITGQQGKEEAISLTPPYHFIPLHRHLGISRSITAQSSSLQIVTDRTEVFPSASR